MLEPFQPASVFANSHVQTTAAFFLRRCHNLTYRRQRLETPDGDFLDLDFALVNGSMSLWNPQEAARPLCLVLHGLEGSARRGYACELYRRLAALGVRGVGLNFRTCGGEMNRTARGYNAGDTRDLRFVLDWLRERFPDAPIGIVGVSLGANLTLKYMGEAGETAVPEVAVAVSPPFDMDAGAKQLDEGSGRFYMPRLLHSLQAKARLKADLVRSHIDLDAALAAKTLRAFDDAWAPLHGCKDAADYYRRNSSGQFVPHIRRATLIIRAVDDPFFSPEDIPHEAIEANTAVSALLPQHGGHVGFVGGSLIQPRFWSEETAASFVASHLFGASETSPLHTAQRPAR